MGRASHRRTDRERLQWIEGQPLYQRNYRRYRSPAGWPRWDRLLQLAAAVAEPSCLQTAAASGDYAGVTASQVMAYALRTEAPARWLAPTLVAELTATTPPPVTTELLEQFPAVHLLLPAGALVGDEGSSLVLLTVASDQAIWSGASGLSVAALAGTARSPFYAVRIGADGAHASTLPVAVPPGDERDEVLDTMERIRRVALGALAVMAFQPELVSGSSHRPQPAAFGASRSRQAPLPPTWIGRDLQPLRPDAPHQVACGTAVRTHWRRGHWHTVRHGPGHSCRRLQWFRPVLVGSSSTAPPAAGPHRRGFG
ncbi:MAG: hypothetical protein AAFX65_08005 [Cyanobacteria bacterium J06638_7]